MPTFPLLASPQTYAPCRWDLAADAPLHAYWLGLFRNHFPKLIAEAVREARDRGLDDAAFHTRVGILTSRFMAYLDQVTADPRSVRRLDILEICDVREKFLRDAGIADPYRLAKKTENDAALLLLPKLLEEIDALPESDRMNRLIQGVFAGNIFDLGAVKTLEMFSQGSVDFRQVRAKLAPRPWLVDDLDPLLARLQRTKPYQCACLFVDNAGFDIVLGMIPFARELLRRRTRVIIAVNEAPSLNDITLAELAPMLEHIAAMDPVMAVALESHALELIGSGCETPLIDLSRVTDELASAVVSQGVDLIVLEGMGRAIESNFDARFTCDTVKVAMIKDAGVAQSMQGKMYDLVLRFEPAK